MRHQYTAHSAIVRTSSLFPLEIRKKILTSLPPPKLPITYSQDFASFLLARGRGAAKLIVLDFAAPALIY